MRIAILDTGAGNLHSLEKALSKARPDARVTIDDDADAALRGDLLVLPGVGAFAAAAARIAASRERLRDALVAGHPCIGICLGMQLLLTRSEEGPGLGIDLVAGEVTRLRTPRTPHMGWSRVRPRDGEEERRYPSAVYYAHSFACRPADERVVVATTELDGDRFPAVIRASRTVGCQFHPEKSSFEGVAYLGRLVSEVTR